MKLSAEARSALRKAITNHANWDNYRRANDLSLATMSRDNYFEAARALGLDVRAIAYEADHNHGSKFQNGLNAIRANGHDKAEAAKEAFSGDDMDDAARLADMARKQWDREAAERQAQEAERNRAAAIRAVPHAGQDDKAAQLLKLIGELSSNSIDAEAVREIVKTELEKHGAGTIRHVIELQRDGLKLGEIKGQHPKFKMLLTMANARNTDGVVPGIFIPGPAGSGKTYAAKKVAETLELPFHFNGSISMSFELLGFIDANGCYHRTPFREAYENGGVYLFDEVDGSDNAAILALNAALANGVATFPDGQVTRHKDFIPMCTANTWGMGANADYVGRAKLDGAFLDRFPNRLYWDYDNELEINISGNPAFAARVQRARERARNLGLKVLITPRASMTGAANIAAGMTPDEAAECTYLANLTPEQRHMIEPAN